MVTYRSSSVDDYSDYSDYSVGSSPGHTGHGTDDDTDGSFPNHLVISLKPSDVTVLYCTVQYHHIACIVDDHFQSLLPIRLAYNVSARGATIRTAHTRRL